MPKTVEIELTPEEIEFLQESLRYAQIAYEHTVATNAMYREAWYRNRFYKEKMAMFSHMFGKLSDAKSRVKPHIRPKQKK